MERWRVELTKNAQEDLDSLERSIQYRILDKLSWLEKNFEHATLLPLQGKWRGFFKLRVGDWRIIYSIHLPKHLLIVCYIDRRDQIYKI